MTMKGMTEEGKRKKEGLLGSFSMKMSLNIKMAPEDI